MQVLPVGGRIKSASVGLNDLYISEDIRELDEHLRRLRDKPPRELLEAFFPSDYSRLRQMMKGVGFYRPILKTEQGMGGNFLPFYIDPNSQNTDLSVRSIQKEEGVAIPEPYYGHKEKIITSVQKVFHELDFKTVEQILQTLDVKREALKGREPFFFIRPAITDKKIVFGDNIVGKVNETVNEYLQMVKQRSTTLEEQYCGVAQDSNLLYCQPDVFILSDKTVFVEKVNCPDVGLFLPMLNDPFSSILPLVKCIVQKLRRVVCKIITNVSTDHRVSLLTRDEVLRQQEDVLEIKEIESLKQGLLSEGITVDVYSLSEVNEIPVGQEVILLNVDYGAEGIRNLFDRHCQGKLKFYPNPFFQLACQEVSALSETIIPSKFHNKFVQLISSRPKDEEALKQVWDRLNQLLCMYDINSDILHVDIGYEIVPVFRRSIHSWQQLARRVKRYNQKEVVIKIRAIPVLPDNLLITSDTGVRLHTFRFMCVDS